MQAHISRIIPWERSVRTPLFAFSSQPSMEICSGWNNVMTLNLLIGTTLRNIPNQQGYFSVNPIFYYGHNSSAANVLYPPNSFSASGVLALNISIGKEWRCWCWQGILYIPGCECGLFFRRFPHIYHGVPNMEVCMIRILLIEMAQSATGV